MDEVRLKRRLTDGDYVVILWQAITVWGVIPVCTVFRIEEGLLASCEE